jgi:hypothetical protein
MSSDLNLHGQPGSAIPLDDPGRELVVAEPDSKLPHIGVVGDTCTVLLSRQRHRRPLLPDRHARAAGWWATTSSP